MKKLSGFTKSTAVIMAFAVLMSSCVSSTMIESIPNGATLYLDGERVGETPYLHRDTKIVGTTTDIRMEREGYKSFHATLQRNEEADAGAIVAGVFTLIPFLWTMNYKPTHTYELTPLYFEPKTNQAPSQMSPAITQPQGAMKSTAERLEELKKLYDNKLITNEDYEKQKQKILESL